MWDRKNRLARAVQGRGGGGATYQQQQNVRLQTLQRGRQLWMGGDRDRGMLPPHSSRMHSHIGGREVGVGVRLKEDVVWRDSRPHGQSLPVTVVETNT